MVEEWRRLRKLVSIGTVGGSDLVKQIEQLGDNGAPGGRLAGRTRRAARWRGAASAHQPVLCRHLSPSRRHPLHHPPAPSLPARLPALPQC